MHTSLLVLTSIADVADSWLPVMHDSHSLGVQEPIGADQFPVAVLHAEKGEPVAAPVQVAVHCVWLLQPLDGHAAFSGVVEGTPKHGFVAAASSSFTAGRG
jgi:hypothetical protein